jgi:diguanylate cyclase (GGDEF)-like protein
MRKRRQFLLLAAVAVQVIVLGLLDHHTYTSCEVSFALFYLFPILQVAWYVGFLPAIATSLFSAAIWYAADLHSEHVYAHHLVPFWIALMRLGFFLTASFLVEKVQRLLKKERELARTDSLTGVANGRHFVETVAIEIQRASRFDRWLSLAFMDLDNLKQVNDALGHSAGDELLRSLAQTIRKNVRASDLVARLGGDEFVVLMPETDLEEAKAAVAKIREQVMNSLRDRNWPITLSIGVATCRSPQCSVDKLIKAADDLMYRVKSDGKNGVKHEMMA